MREERGKEGVLLRANKVFSQGKRRGRRNRLTLSYPPKVKRGWGDAVISLLMIPNSRRKRGKGGFSFLSLLGEGERRGGGQPPLH